MRNLVATLLALKTLKVKKEIQNKEIPWLNYEDSDANSDDGNNQNLDGSQAKVENILDLLSEKLYKSTLDRLEKAKDAGVADLESSTTSL